MPRPALDYLILNAVADDVESVATIRGKVESPGCSTREGRAASGMPVAGPGDLPVFLKRSSGPLRFHGASPRILVVPRAARGALRKRSPTSIDRP